VAYAPGVLEARATRRGTVVLTDKRETAGPAVKIVAAADRSRILGDGQDVAVINVTIVDAQGRPVPDASNMVAFKVTGPGNVLGVGNGDPSCHEPDIAGQRSAFNGLCMAIVRGTRGPRGDFTVTVESTGLEAAVVAIAAEAATPIPAVD
jgi:beta-galactosidase